MIHSISVENVRNLKISDLNLNQKTTIIVGENGQGKTNLLEAIYFLAYGKSFIADKSRVLNWHTDEGFVRGKIDETNIQIVIRKNRDNQILVNGKRRGLAQLLGTFLCVSFHPQDIDMITGAPSLRRNWIDRLCSTMDRAYLKNLVSYNRAIQNRNKLLKQIENTSQIEIWNEVASDLGIKIWRKRFSTVDKVNEILKKEAAKIINKDAFLGYEVPLDLSSKDTKNLYKQKLEQLQEKDVRLSATTFGPHRDDFKIIFEEKKDRQILEKEVNFYGSRAEQRQAVLLLKLAEMRLLREEFGEYPTLLLDDVSSELDEAGREFLTKPITKQLIVTTTSLSLLPAEMTKKSTIYKMEKGKLYSSGSSAEV